MASPARSSYKTAATSSTDANREGDATTTDIDYTTKHRIRSSDHATRIQLSSPHRRPSPDKHQRLPSHRLRRKSEKKSQAPATDRSIQYCSYHYKEEYPLHEKYDLQDALSNKLHENDVAIIKAQRLLREEDEMNIDLSAYFLHRPWKKDWLRIKGPTSKYYHEEFYAKMEELAESGKPQKNIISWFGFLERSCGDPRGKYPYVRVELR